MNSLDDKENEEAGRVVAGFWCGGPVMRDKLLEIVRDRGIKSARQLAAFWYGWLDQSLGRGYGNTRDHRFCRQLKRLGFGIAETRKPCTAHGCVKGRVTTHAGLISHPCSACMGRAYTSTWDLT